MLLAFYVLMFLVSACLVLLMPVLWGWDLYQRYRGSRAVTCPETHRQVAVNFDALHAAVTGMSARPDLRLADCTHWPERADCGQDCIPEARRTPEYTLGELAPPRAKKIYHLPVLIAVSAAWVLGLVWHSEYLFRGRWAAALNIDDRQVREVVEWFSPHLLSVGVLLLFAYGVAWLLALAGKKGAGWGIVTAALFWAATLVASLLATGVAGVPEGLLWVEAAYMLLASVAIGAIIGGLNGKLIRQRFHEA
ncbi:MAG TPA: DUF1761 domain-containing protein [Terriglobales bacterium]|jgi:hypothetical protein|nr:DUF1761 domain-containing protein [Terriglobales bacterium]